MDSAVDDGSCLGPGHIYPVDTEIVFQGTFTAAGPGGPTTPPVLVDPTIVTLFLQDPTGAVTSYLYPGPVTRAGVGVYQYTFTPPMPGQWVFQWRGTGVVTASSFLTPFAVQSSAPIPM